MSEVPHAASMLRAGRSSCVDGATEIFWTAFLMLASIFLVTANSGAAWKFVRHAEGWDNPSSFNST